MHGYRRVAPLPWAEAVELESDITRGGCHGTVPARLVVGQEARAETRLSGRSIRTISTVVVAVSRVRATAQRLEDELGEERSGFITGCPADWAALPRPDLPLVVGLDGGYVQLLHATDPPGRLVRGDRRQGHARRRAVIVFRVRADLRQQTPNGAGSRCLPPRGCKPNQQVTFLTDGGEDIRELPALVPRPLNHTLHRQDQAA